MTVPFWRIAFATDHVGLAGTAADALAATCEGLSLFETADGKAWQLEALSRQPVDRVRLETQIELVALSIGVAAPAVSIERLTERDWLKQNEADFPPLAIGRFFIHGSHWRALPPPSSIPLLIDAALAFGTGEHASTQGCLLALENIARRRSPARILDMGTGTGILAIAAAKRWRRRVIARDIDAMAVAMAQHNAQRNGVGVLVDVDRSDAYRAPGLRHPARFDLVFANILARPLSLMAKDLARVLKPGGVAVLSGLLARQEPQVLAAHRALGLSLRRRIARDGWHTLILARGKLSDEIPFHLPEESP